jgi:alpha-ribazole phosphatase
VANIYLLRHGKVSGEAALYGQTDVDVSIKNNQEIITQLEEELKAQGITFAGVVSSPLKRCKNLAKMIASNQQVNLKLIEYLQEMNFGIYDGIPFDDLYQDKDIWQQLVRFWENPVQHTLPKAELLTGFSYRVIKAWNEIVISMREKENILIVCHGGVIRVILAHVFNIDFRNPDWYTRLSIANGSLTCVEIKNDNCKVKQIAKPLITDKNQELENGLVTQVLPSSLLNEQRDRKVQSQGVH